MVYDTELHPILTHYIAWLKSHEKVLIITLAAWLAFHFYGSGLNAWIEHDKRNATIAQQKVQNDSTANQQLTQQVADLKQQLATLSAQAQARQQERIVVVQQQKEKIQQAPSSELASSIATLINVPPTEVTATADGQVALTQNAAKADATQLIDGHAAEDELVDVKAELAASTTVTKQDDDLIVGLRKQIADTGYLPDKDGKLKCQGGLCQADINRERAKARKSWLNGFKWGAVVGFVGGIVTLKKF